MEFEILIKRIEKIIPCVSKGYFVGGCVRDCLLNITEIKDIDIAIPELNYKVLECLRKATGKKGFLYKKEKTVFTIEKLKQRIDITEIQKTIENDLKERDFTINAIAVKIESVLEGKPVIIDPLNGLKDLKDRVLKPVNETSIKKDPVRILRGIRIKNKLLLKYHNSFETICKKYSILLKKEPIERIKDELIKILKLSNSYTAFCDMRELKVLYLLFPEIQKQEAVPPSGLHQYPLIIHTLKTVEKINLLIDGKLKTGIDKRLIELVRKTVYSVNLTGRESIIITALLHDIGKPFTVKDKNGKLTFYNHDKEGSTLAEKRLKNLGFGKNLVQDVSKIIKLHLRPFFLYQLHIENKLSEKAIVKFLFDSDRVFPFVVLHSIADFCATSEKMEKEIFHFTNFINRNLIPFFEKFENLKPFLSGKDIMEIKKIESGEIVGKIKKKLLEMQLLGKIKSREEAEKFVKGFSL